MFLGPALKLCPDLKTIPYDFPGYEEVSRILYDTVASYTLDIQVALVYSFSCQVMWIRISCWACFFCINFALMTSFIFLHLLVSLFSCLLVFFLSYFLVCFFFLSYFLVCFSSCLLYMSVVDLILFC